MLSTNRIRRLLSCKPFVTSTLNLIEDKNVFSLVKYCLQLHKTKLRRWSKNEIDCWTFKLRVIFYKIICDSIFCNCWLSSDDRANWIARLCKVSDKKNKTFQVEDWFNLLKRTIYSWTLWVLCVNLIFINGACAEGVRSLNVEEESIHQSSHITKWLKSWLRAFLSSKPWESIKCINGLTVLQVPG